VLNDSNLFSVNKNFKLIVITFIFLTKSFLAQNFLINKIEPPNWWINLKPDTVQLLIYGRNLQNVTVESKNKYLKVISVKNGASPNYLFLYFKLLKMIPGNYLLKFKKKNQSVKVIYKIKQRANSKKVQQGFSSNDVIYLIFVDRFCDGNPENDNIKNKFEKFNPLSVNGRHGGDLQGIINKLSYLKQLGVTTLWITPVLENNMWMSYHGYAATDLYKVDPRFGSNRLYRLLVKKAHKIGLKVIMDHVSNHIGINHQWVKSLPAKKWFHGNRENHPRAQHNKIAYFDIHADSLTPLETQRGWFTNYMPDLNKSNKLLADYMIENTIWWIEYLGIDGIREDTYPYNNLIYLSKWAQLIKENFPDFSIVAEVWKGLPAFVSEYQANPKINMGFNSFVKSVTDYPLYDAVVKFLKGESDGLKSIYETLAEDFLYSNPNSLMTFIDNHDVDRALSVAGGDVSRFKSALGFILTTRGIPQLFYGTEIGLTGSGKDGLRRKHFIGGFPKDKRNAFLPDGKTKTEKEIFNFTERLLKIRKKFVALRKGKLIQFPPVNNVYLYFRIFKSQRIMIIINGNKKAKRINLNKQGYLIKSGILKNLFSGEKLKYKRNLTITLPEEAFNIYEVLEK